MEETRLLIPLLIPHQLNLPVSATFNLFVLRYALAPGAIHTGPQDSY